MSPEDYTYQQLLLKSLMEDKNPMNQFSESQAEFDLVNPERSYESPTLGRVVNPFEVVADEVGAKKELDKYSNKFYGSDFNNQSQSNKLRLMIELDKAKKETGLKGDDIWQ